MTNHHEIKPCTQSTEKENNIVIDTKELHNITNPFKCGLGNWRSIINKASDLKVHIIQLTLDISVLTETWIKEHDDTTPAQISPAGYSSISVPRKDKTVGGLALIHRYNLTVKSNSTYKYNTMECTDFVLSLPNINISTCVVYRSPSTSVLAFCDELAHYTERIIIPVEKYC